MMDRIHRKKHARPSTVGQRSSCLASAHVTSTSTVSHTSEPCAPTISGWNPAAHHESLASHPLLAELYDTSGITLQVSDDICTLLRKVAAVGPNLASSSSTSDAVPVPAASTQKCGRCQTQTLEQINTWQLRCSACSQFFCVTSPPNDRQAEYASGMVEVNRLTGTHMSVVRILERAGALADERMFEGTDDAGLRSCVVEMVNQSKRCPGDAPSHLTIAACAVLWHAHPHLLTDICTTCGRSCVTCFDHAVVAGRLRAGSVPSSLTHLSARRAATTAIVELTVHITLSSNDASAVRFRRYLVEHASAGGDEVHRTISIYRHQLSPDDEFVGVLDELLAYGADALPSHVSTLIRISHADKRDPSATLEGHIKKLYATACEFGEVNTRGNRALTSWITRSFHASNAIYEAGDSVSRLLHARERRELARNRRATTLIEESRLWEMQLTINRRMVQELIELMPVVVPPEFRSFDRLYELSVRHLRSGLQECTTLFRPDELAALCMGLEGADDEALVHEARPELFGMVAVALERDHAPPPILAADDLHAVLVPHRKPIEVFLDAALGSNSYTYAIWFPNPPTTDTFFGYILALRAALVDPRMEVVCAADRISGHASSDDDEELVQGTIWNIASAPSPTTLSDIVRRCAMSDADAVVLTDVFVLDSGKAVWFPSDHSSVELGDFANDIVYVTDPVYTPLGRIDRDRLVAFGSSVSFPCSWWLSSKVVHADVARQGTHLFVGARCVGRLQDPSDEESAVEDENGTVMRGWRFRESLPHWTVQLTSSLCCVSCVQQAVVALKARLPSILVEGWLPQWSLDATLACLDDCDVRVDDTLSVSLSGACPDGWARLLLQAARSDARWLPHSLMRLCLLRCARTHDVYQVLFGRPTSLFHGTEEALPLPRGIHVRIAMSCIMNAVLELRRGGLLLALHKSREDPRDSEQRAWAVSTYQQLVETLPPTMNSSLAAVPLSSNRSLEQQAMMSPAQVWTLLVYNDMCNDAELGRDVQYDARLMSFDVFRQLHTRAGQLEPPGAIGQWLDAPTTAAGRQPTDGAAALLARLPLRTIRWDDVHRAYTLRQDVADLENLPLRCQTTDGASSVYTLELWPLWKRFSSVCSDLSTPVTIDHVLRASESACDGSFPTPYRLHDQIRIDGNPHAFSCARHLILPVDMDDGTVSSSDTPIPAAEWTVNSLRAFRHTLSKRGKPPDVSSLRPNFHATLGQLLASDVRQLLGSDDEFQSFCASVTDPATASVGRVAAAADIAPTTISKMVQALEDERSRLRKGGAPKDVPWSFAPCCHLGFQLHPEASAYYHPPCDCASASRRRCPAVNALAKGTHPVQALLIAASTRARVIHHIMQFRGRDKIVRGEGALRARILQLAAHLRTTLLRLRRPHYSSWLAALEAWPLLTVGCVSSCAEEFSLRLTDLIAPVSAAHARHLGIRLSAIERQLALSGFRDGPTQRLVEALRAGLTLFAPSRTEPLPCSGDVLSDMSEDEDSSTSSAAAIRVEDAARWCKHCHSVCRIEAECNVVVHQEGQPRRRFVGAHIAARRMPDVFEDVVSVYEVAAAPRASVRVAMEESLNLFAACTNPKCLARWRVRDGAALWRPVDSPSRHQLVTMAMNASYDEKEEADFDREALVERCDALPHTVADMRVMRAAIESARDIVPELDSASYIAQMRGRWGNGTCAQEELIDRALSWFGCMRLDSIDVELQRLQRLLPYVTDPRRPVVDLHCPSKTCARLEVGVRVLRRDNQSWGTIVGIDETHRVHVKADAATSVDVVAEHDLRAAQKCVLIDAAVHSDDRIRRLWLCVCCRRIRIAGIDVALPEDVPSQESVDARRPHVPGAVPCPRCKSWKTGFLRSEQIRRADEGAEEMNICYACGHQGLNWRP
jgi:DNA-directed RNA polymerase subunit M/transcription elongation factor TFIIS